MYGTSATDRCIRTAAAVTADPIGFSPVGTVSGDIWRGHGLSPGDLRRVSRIRPDAAAARHTDKHDADADVLRGDHAPVALSAVRGG